MVRIGFLDCLDDDRFRVAIDIGDQIVTAFLFDQQFINSIDGSANNLPSTAGSPQSDVDHWLHGWVLATPLGAVC